MTNDTAEQELRDLHARWFAAAAAKDLEGCMAPISGEVVSYEHSSPLQVTRLEDVREECRRGFELQGDGFSWTVPDLEVRVSGDLAVAWGLNRMASLDADGVEQVSWSRGTRVFARVEDRWVMVHQHVSFPVDPATGMAATDLTP